MCAHVITVFLDSQRRCVDRRHGTARHQGGIGGPVQENLEITVEGQRFTLTGQRADPDREGAKFLVTEIHHGRFESVVEVPEEFDTSRARAEYQNGILRIAVPPRIINRLKRS